MLSTVLGVLDVDLYRQILLLDQNLFKILRYKNKLARLLKLYSIKICDTTVVVECCAHGARFMLGPIVLVHRRSVHKSLYTYSLEPGATLDSKQNKKYVQDIYLSLFYMLQVHPILLYKRKHQNKICQDPSRFRGPTS